MLRTIQILRIVARGLTVLALALVVVAAGGLLYLHSQGARLLSVQSDSMVPTFQRGDALIVTPATDLKPGTVISYHNPVDNHVIISHRLVNAEKGRLTTAGDALRSKDIPFSPNLVVGQARAVLPKFGYMLDTLKRPVGLIVAVYIPALVLIIYELRHLVIGLNRVQYRLNVRL